MTVKELSLICGNITEHTNIKIYHTMEHLVMNMPVYRGVFNDIPGYYVICPVRFFRYSDVTNTMVIVIA